MRGIWKGSELAVKPEVASGRPANAGYARNQKDKMLQVAALHGQFVDGSGVDPGTEIRSVGFEQRSFRHYLHGRLRAAQLQLGIYPHHLACRQCDVGNVTDCKAACRKVSTVSTGYKVDGSVVTRVVSLQGHRDVRLDISDGYIDPGHQRALWVGKNP